MGEWKGIMYCIITRVLCYPWRDRKIAEKMSNSLKSNTEIDYSVNQNKTWAEWKEHMG